MGLGNLGDLSNLDLGQLQQYLPNMNFPASKDEVISEVQNNDAPQDVIDQLKNSSTDSFNNADEVLQTVRGEQVVYSKKVLSWTRLLRRVQVFACASIGRVRALSPLVAPRRSH